MKKILSVLIFLLIQNCSSPQNLSSAITVSPLIGEKLDRIENEYFYKLFPGFEGFEEAIFYINPDSSLVAKVTYEKDNLLKDSTFNYYYDLSTVQKYLINKVISDLSIDSSNIEKVRLVLNDDSEEITSLYSITENAVNTLSIPNRKVTSYNNNQIRKIVIKSGTSVWPYRIAGTLLGIVGGVIIAKSMVNPPKAGTIDEYIGTNLENELAPIGGIIIGSVIGYFLGEIIGSSIKVDEEFIINEHDSFCNLKSHTILFTKFSLR